MTNEKEQYDIGIIGLGVMGRNLLLNMKDHGFSVVGYDIDKIKIGDAQKKEIHATDNINMFIDLLKKPRAILLLVPAGKSVDLAINDLLPHLQSGDLIIDAGNSHFTDTNRRSQYLKAKKIKFLGVGISGGEEGARRGPSIMPGGDKEAYERVHSIFEAIAAKVNGEPCVSYLGNGSAGHYVKMVHNGIEYGIMQLIAEFYDVMKRGLGFNNMQLQEVFETWGHTKLNSYLLEITSHIFSKKDEKTGKLLIDEILPVAKQKGTGIWTSQSALELQVPVSVIDIAVSMRDLSVLANEREQANVLYKCPPKQLSVDLETFLPQLQKALLTAVTIVYAQGMALLAVASENYQYQIDLETVARIWRGGCIIRANLLEDIRNAFSRNKNLPNLLLDPNFADMIIENVNALREVISQVCKSGIPIPAIMASLSYFDSYRSAWLPANLIQAQRDYFGAHTYERIDSDGTFHTEWIL